MNPLRLGGIRRAGRSPISWPTIAAVVLGGASIVYRRGGHGGTLVGAAVTVLLSSNLQVVGIAQAGQSVTYGVVILAMLVLVTDRELATIR